MLIYCVCVFLRKNKIRVSELERTDWERVSDRRLAFVFINIETWAYSASNLPAPIRNFVIIGDFQTPQIMMLTFNRFLRYDDLTSPLRISSHLIERKQVRLAVQRLLERSDRSERLYATIINHRFDHSYLFHQAESLWNGPRDLPDRRRVAQKSDLWTLDAW